MFPKSSDRSSRAAVLRASSLRAGATASSRSTITASHGSPAALDRCFSEMPGTNSADRKGRHCNDPMNKGMIQINTRQGRAHRNVGDRTTHLSGLHLAGMRGAADRDLAVAARRIGWKLAMFSIRSR